MTPAATGAVDPGYKRLVTSAQQPEGNGLRWLERPTLARISADATGWTMQPETLAALLEVQWDYVSISDGSVCGVVSQTSGDAVTVMLSPLTANRPELDRVELRQDVAAAIVSIGSNVARGVTMAAFDQACAQVGTRPVATFVGPESIAWVVDAWRRPAIETALGSTTSLSG